MDIRKIPTAKLNPAAYNPRKDLKPGDAEYEKLRRSIEEFGYVEPIIWNSRTGNIVGGHQRFKILVALGYEDVDSVVLDIDEQKEKALNDIAGKFNDPDYLDSLSADAETEIKRKFRAQTQEFSNYQNQYLQILQQTNLKVIQKLTEAVSDAAKKYATEN